MNMVDLKALIADEVRKISMPSDADLTKMQIKAQRYDQLISMYPKAPCLDGSCGQLHNIPTYSPDNVSECDDGHCFPSFFKRCPYCMAQEEEEE